MVVLICQKEQPKSPRLCLALSSFCSRLEMSYDCSECKQINLTKTTRSAIRERQWPLVRITTRVYKKERVYLCAKTSCFFLRRQVLLKKVVSSVDSQLKWFKIFTVFSLQLSVILSYTFYPINKKDGL